VYWLMYAPPPLGWAPVFSSRPWVPLEGGVLHHAGVPSGHRRQAKRAGRAILQVGLGRRTPQFQGSRTKRRSKARRVEIILADQAVLPVPSESKTQPATPSTRFTRLRFIMRVLSELSLLSLYRIRRRLSRAKDGQ